MSLGTSISVTTWAFKKLEFWSVISFAVSQNSGSSSISFLKYNKIEMY